MRKSVHTQSFDFSLVGEEKPLIINGLSEEDSKRERRERQNEAQVEVPTRQETPKPVEEAPAHVRSDDCVKFFLSEDDGEKYGKGQNPYFVKKRRVNCLTIGEDQNDFRRIEELKNVFREEVNGKLVKGEHPSTEGYVRMAWKAALQIERFEKNLDDCLESNRRLGTLRTMTLWMGSICSYIDTAMKIEKSKGSTDVDLNKLNEECRAFKTHLDLRLKNFKDKVDKSNLQE